MYLNLDLLYNVNDFLFPLFYYENKEKNGREVYCPITKKGIYFFKGYSKSYFFNYKIRKLGTDTCVRPFNIQYYFTSENVFNKTEKVMTKTSPFKLSQKDIKFLKSSFE